eukprot:1135262-Pleurochrysis_carterae.AAC.2
MIGHFVNSAVWSCIAHTMWGRGSVYGHLKLMYLFQVWRARRSRSSAAWRQRGRNTAARRPTAGLRPTLAPQEATAASTE